MIVDVEKLLERMDKIQFDSSTDITAFLTQYFPSLLHKRSALETYWKELTWSNLEESIRMLSQDSKKHTLMESYEYIENKKDIPGKRHLSILSTSRGAFLFTKEKGNVTRN